MKLVLKRAVAVVVAVGVVFGAGACAGTASEADKATAGATPTRSVEPKEALANSLTSYDKGVYAVTFTAYDGTGTAKVDATKKNAHLKQASNDPDFTFSMELLALGTDTFMKIDMGEAAKLPGLELATGKKWLHVDRSKIENFADLGIDVTRTDFLSLRAMLGSAQSVQAAGERKYTGTLDLSKDENSPLTDGDLLDALGTKASAVPFTATLDAQGRLVELVLDVPAAGEAKAQQLKIALSEYGAVTFPAAPTGGDVVEAPAGVYEMLNT